MRTYDVLVAGVKHELPTSMAVLHAGEKASDSSINDLFLENSISGYLVQGIIYAGLKSIGVEEIGGEPLSYDAVGRVCSFSEAVMNRLALLAAIAPDESGEDEGGGEKNGKTGLVGG